MKQYLVIAFVNRNNYREINVVRHYMTYEEARIEADWLNLCLKKDGEEGKGIRYSVYAEVEA